MLMSIPITRKSFFAETSKKAYIKANKWVAINILNVEELKDSTINFIKVDEGQIDIVVYTTLDMADEKSKFCKICKDYHKSFFINEEYNCKRCNCITFLKKTQSRLKIRKSYKKEILKE